MSILPKTLLLVATSCLTLAFSAILYHPEVQYLQGRVEMRPESKLNWSNLQVHQQIQHNQTLRSSEDSKAQVAFKNGWFFEMGESSHLQYFFSRGEGVHQVSFSSLEGQLFFSLPYCAECEHIKTSWYMGPSVITGQVADFSIESQGAVQELKLYRGSLVFRLDDQVKLLKAPILLKLVQKQFKLYPLLDTIHTHIPIVEKVEQVTQSRVTGQLRGHIGFQSTAAPSVDRLSWNIPRFFQQWNQHFLDSVGVSHGEINNPSPNQSANFVGSTLENLTHKVEVDYRVFDLNSTATQWSLRVEVDFKIHSKVAHSLEDSWTFSKFYQGKVDDESDLRFLKYLPLDSKNQKIKNSFFDELWKDYEEECLKRIVDPLYKKPGELF